MLTATTALTDTLKKGDAVATKARVYAEWNHNRYTPIATVDNFGYPEADNGYDLETFPISSITEPIRPTAGIAFGITGQATTSTGHSSVVSPTRYYTTDPNSKYKYWVSPVTSDATKAIANCKPYIIYSAPVWTNKIYLCFEESWTAPANYIVEYTVDGTTWVTAATNPVVGSDGTVELYLQANGTWSALRYYSNAMQIRGLRVTVTTLTRANSYFSLIEMGARLHNELTDYLISYDITNELSDADRISPMGVISSNTASVKLSNFDGRFNDDNASSLYFGIIDANVKFTIDLGIDTTANGGSGVEYIRQATMYAETWSGGSEDVTVELKDASKFLQEIFPLSMLMQDVGVGKAIWSLLDSIGFTAYQYNAKADKAESVIPFFWTSSDKTVWDTIQALCRSTQTACYFDQYGILQIETRDAAFDKTQADAWTFDYAKNGTKQPDIVELSVANAFEANHVTVNYKPTGLSEDDQHRPISEIVWQPEEDLVLRSSALFKDMTATETTYMTIDPKDAAYWPYEGMVNVRGEIIKYSGKQYKYVNKSNGWTTQKVSSVEEKLNIDNNFTADGQQYRNVFTGTMYITERGVGETIAQANDSTIAGWLNNAYYGKGDTTMRKWNGGLKHIPEDGILRLQTNKTFTGNHWYVANRTPTERTGTNFYFGTRMRFPSSGAGSGRCAGLFFSADSTQRNMYVVDIMTTKAVSPWRSIRNEVVVMRRNGNGTNTYLGKGATVGISDNQWFDVDVQCVGATISVAINGRVVLNTTDPRTDLPNTSRQGLHVRGFTVADFEYYYFASFTGGIFDTDLDNSSYIDLRLGGYYSTQFYKDYTYHNSTRSVGIADSKATAVKMQSAQKLFDEFGMQVHEIRDFDVKFEKPVLYSSLYVSNQDQTVVPNYTGTPFGAKFTIANAARINAVVNGDDSTLGTDNIVNQKAMVTARTIQQKEQKSYEVKDDAQIRARGEIALTFDSEWIQTEAAAKALGDWIVNNWSKPADEISMEVYANPLLQVGDLVSINYSPHNMSASTHKYFVLSVSQGWDEGPTTNLELRRANI